MKKTTKLVAAGALAAALVAGTAVSASAVYGGYRDCPSGKVVQLASETTGKTLHYYNGNRVLMQTLSAKAWRYSMTAPAVNNFEILGSPLYNWSTSCQS